MKLFVRPVDLTSVNTIVYHLPDGPSLSLNVDGIEEFIDLELEQGHYCDTSDIDGTLHFFPKEMPETSSRIHHFLRPRLNLLFSFLSCPAWSPYECIIYSGWSRTYTALQARVRHYGSSTLSLQSTKGFSHMVFLEHLEEGIDYFERTWLTEQNLDHPS